MLNISICVHVRLSFERFCKFLFKPSMAWCGGGLVAWWYLFYLLVIAERMNGCECLFFQFFLFFSFLFSPRIVKREPRLVKKKRWNFCKEEYKSSPQRRMVKKKQFKAANIRYGTRESGMNEKRRQSSKRPWWALNIHTQIHEHQNEWARTTQLPNKENAKRTDTEEQEQRMQAITGVSMFYARSCRINSGIIHVEWMLFCVLTYPDRTWTKCDFVSA